MRRGGEASQEAPTSHDVARSHRSSVALRARPQAVSELLASVARGAFQLAPPLASVATWIADFFKRYGDREPQLADASLVYLADHQGTTTVFTLDRSDFSVYRTNAGKAFSLLPRPR